MGSVERINFAVPPPGYFREPGTEFVRQGHGKRRTLAEAWARWKTKRDPPGLEVRRLGAGWVYHCRKFVDPRSGALTIFNNKDGQRFADEPSARAAAWDWYLRRLAIVVALEFVGVTLDLWPAALLWSDEDCKTIDAWLGRGPSWLPNDFPEVLRG